VRVLVTGGAGYIGAVLCEHLLLAGHQVVVLDRLFWGRSPLQNLEVDVICGDLREMREAWLDGIDAVMHLGGLSNDPTAEYNADANWQMNAVATERLVALCKKRKIERFTFASSASVYDTESSATALDRVPAECDENTALAPRGHYSISKVHAEKAILDAADEHFAPVVFRQGTVFGWSPRMRFDLVVNTFIKDAVVNRKLYLHGGGWMWRPLVDVSDVARVHVRTLEMPLERLRGEIFNVLEENYQIRELAMLVAGSFAVKDTRIALVETPLPKGIVRNYRVSNAKLSKAFGFTPSVSVLESIENMIEKLPSAIDELAHPRHYNVRWMSLLEEIHESQREFKSIY
jgi:nucleoside-diphosphate-sugar epimerase